MTSPNEAPPRHRRHARPLRIALLDAHARAADADWFDIVQHEIGRRLVEQGHTVSVSGHRRNPHRVDLADLPVPRLGSLSRSAVVAAHLGTVRRQDVVFAFGLPDGRFAPLLRSRGAAVAVHVGSLEWQREQRNRGRGLRRAERVAVREADALIADCGPVADRYGDEFAVPVEVIRSGSRVLRHVPSDEIEGVGLVPGAFHLAMDTATDRHLDVVIEGYHRSGAALPLVVVAGSARLPASLEPAVRRDPRIRLIRDLPGPRLREQLAAHALSSLHGDSFGGANPSMLGAMASGTPVIAWEVAANRDVAGTAGSYFSTPTGLAYELEQVERYPLRFRDIGELMQERVQTRHDWDAAAEAYATLAAKLARGYSTRGMSDGHRIDAAAPRAYAAVGVQRG